MRDRLVSIFKTNPNTSFATSELVERTHPDEYQRIQQRLAHGDDEAQRDASREKNRLHRKLLYHLRRLQDNNTITTTRRKQNGEKVFTHNDTNAPDPTRDLNITFDLPAQTTSQALRDAKTEDHATLSHDHDNDPCIDAVRLDAARLTRSKVLNAAEKLAEITRDVIAIANIEALFDHDLRGLLDDLNVTANQTDTYICVHLSLDDAPANPTKDFTKAFYEHTSTNAKLVCAASYHENKHGRYQAILNEAQRTRRKAHFAFTDTTTKHAYVGRNGPYTAPPPTSSPPITCLCHTTFTIDTNAFLNEHNSLTKLRSLIEDAAKHTYLATADARNDISLALTNYFDHSVRDAFFTDTQNYIRCWNYTTNGDNTPSFNAYKTLIDTAKQQVNSITHKQRTIFQACGIPLHADITVAPAISTGVPDTFTERAYTKQTLYGLQELSQDDWQAELKRREATARIYDYTDRMRIFRAPETRAENITAEIKHIHKHHALPLLCYDFQRLTKEQQLHQYL